MKPAPPNMKWSETITLTEPLHDVRATTLPLLVDADTAWAIMASLDEAEDLLRRVHLRGRRCRKRALAGAVAFPAAGAGAIWRDLDGARVKQRTDALRLRNKWISTDNRFKCNSQRGISSSAFGCNRTQHVFAQRILFLY